MFSLLTSKFFLHYIRAKLFNKFVFSGDHPPSSIYRCVIQSFLVRFSPADMISQTNQGNVRR